MFTPSGGSERQWVSRDLTHIAELSTLLLISLSRNRHTEDAGNVLWATESSMDKHTYTVCRHTHTHSETLTHCSGTARSNSWTTISFMTTEGDLEKCGHIPGELAHITITHTLHGVHRALAVSGSPGSLLRPTESYLWQTEQYTHTHWCPCPCTIHHIHNSNTA